MSEIDYFLQLWCLLVLGQANSSNRRKEPSWIAVLYSSWRSIKTDIRISMVMRKLFTWELSVRVCQDEWVSVCVLEDKRGEELLLVRPKTTYWASRTSSERARTREASRTWQRNHQGRSAEKQAIPCLKSNQIITGRTTWTNAYNILIRFTLKRRGLFKDGVNSDQSLVWAE